MANPQVIVHRNGYNFIFYDYDDDEDVQTMLDYMYYIYSAPNFQVQNNLIFVGDSNMRRAYDSNQGLFNFGFNYEVFAQGGRRAYHLRELYPIIIQSKYICIAVGGNDLNSTSHDALIKYYTEFIGHLPSQNTYIVRIMQLFPRKDHNPENLKAFNQELKRKLPSYYYPTNVLKRSNFFEELVRERCHLQPQYYNKLLKLMLGIGNNMIFNSHNAP